MTKIAIYGGSFDPPHKGHRLLAENLMKSCGALKVIVIPTAMSPFKNSSGASAEDRLQMCRLAFSDEVFEVSDIEISRGGKSYTVDTVAAVKAMYPDAELYLFMGDDMLLSFDKWYKHEEILRIATIVCA
jgi:nicotinate-nucleotide adenylyltransferase